MLHLTMMCVDRGFILFWNTKCHTPFAFLLRILCRTSRQCSSVYLWPILYHSTHKHLIAVLHLYVWLKFYSWLFHMGIVSARRYRQYIFYSVTLEYNLSIQRQTYFHLLGKSYKFRQLLECPHYCGAVSLGSFSFGHLSVFYLMISSDQILLTKNNVILSTSINISRIIISSTFFVKKFDIY